VYTYDPVLKDEQSTPDPNWMPKKTDIVILSRGEKLRDSRRQGTSMSLPLAVYHRLDLLADAAEDVSATRAEIIGMLIAGAEIDPGALEQGILRYRKMRVGDVVPEEGAEAPTAPIEDADNVVSIQRRAPGRPARS
jgi:hypothetical protein